MIGRLRGAVAEVGEEEALIDVMGVGYVVRCGGRTLSRLPALGEEALLHIESQWSESAGLRLYGFGTREDRRAFVLLQAIQGVGPKAAMAVLDVIRDEGLQENARLVGDYFAEGLRDRSVQPELLGHHAAGVRRFAEHLCGLGSHQVGPSFSSATKS